MEELFALVRKIPHGRCAAYGLLANSLEKRVSGLVVGRWMARAPDGVPWWRVVAKDGRLPIWKVSPFAADEQRIRLEAEGVEFEDDRVAPAYLLDADELAGLDDRP